MNSILLEFYFLIAIILLMIAYAGFEGTMRVFVYLELQIKYAYIRIIMYFMGRKLRRQLNITRRDFDAESKSKKD